MAKQAISSIVATACLLLAILVLAANALLSYQHTRDLAQRETDLQRAQAVLTELQTVLATVTNATAAQRGYLMTGEESFLAPVRPARAEVYEALHRLDAIALHPATIRYMPGLYAAVDAAFANLDAGVSLRQTSPTAPLPATLLAESKTHTDAVRSAVTAMQANEELLVAQRTAISREGLHNLFTTLGIATAVAIATVLLAFWQVRANERRRAHFLVETGKRDVLLRETGERFGTVADNMPQLAWMAEPDGSIFWYNQRWFDYTGTTLDDMKGWGWQKVNHPDHVEHVTEGFKKQIATGHAWEDTFPLRGKDGEYRWFLSRAVPILDKKGRVVRWFGTNTDVTESREIEDALRRSRTHLKEAIEDVKAARDEAEAARQAAVDANVAKSQFLANMSHELRTPLNAVIMYSELLQEEAEDAKVPQFIPDLDKIRGAGQHLLALVNGVLDLSKIEAGKMDLYLETFDAAAMTKDVIATVQPLIAKRKNVLDLKLPESPVTMHSDVTKVRQVLFNLLSNASKFTENGTIGLEIKPIDAGGDSFVEFIVTDTGVGMTAEQLAKLFQPFTQADASTTRKFGGTGLGLAITKRFCEMLGGEVSATSEQDKGSTFIVHIPTRLSKVEIKPVEAANAMPTELRPVTALVIDDEAAVREVVARALAGDGVQTIAAADGEEGLRMAKETLPDMIFLDVLMPKMDGWAVLTALKADPATTGIPVILMTLMNEAEMGYVLGASEYLHKPIDRDRLYNVIGKYRSQAGGDEVLVIEDDDTTREVVRRSLVKDGWTVAEAVNGRDGLDKVRHRIPALILLDLMMPEMDGFEFLDEFRKNPDWEVVPVVVITSQDLSQADRTRLSGNVERIVQKGTYSRDALLGEVRKIAAQCARHVPAGLKHPPAEPAAN